MENTCSIVVQLKPSLSGQDTLLYNLFCCQHNSLSQMSKCVVNLTKKLILPEYMHQQNRNAICS